MSEHLDAALEAIENGLLEHEGQHNEVAPGVADEVIRAMLEAAPPPVRRCGTTDYLVHEDGRVEALSPRARGMQGQRPTHVILDEVDPTYPDQCLNENARRVYDAARRNYRRSE